SCPAYAAPTVRASARSDELGRRYGLDFSIAGFPIGLGGSGNRAVPPASYEGHPVSTPLPRRRHRSPRGSSPMVPAFGQSRRWGSEGLCDVSGLLVGVEPRGVPIAGKPRVHADLTDVGDPAPVEPVVEEGRLEVDAERRSEL